MEKLRKVSLRFPESLMKVLEGDVSSQRVASLSDAARRRLQLSVTHEELLKEMQQLRKAQEKMQHDMKLLLFGFKQLGLLVERQVANG